MRQNVFPLLIASLLAGFVGCASSGTDATLARIGSERITVRDFEDAYAKNNGGWDKGATASLEERERFLDLLVKFKLKVQEARSQGLLQDSTIQQELKTYGISVATSYMLDKELVEPNIKEMFGRKKEEVRASHILIGLRPDPSPQDTAAAYELAMNVLQQIPTLGFDSMAVKYSQDPSVSTNKGDLGYFSGGRTVREFEDAAYRLPVGEYTRLPVRTQFGYHIIKVTGRRPAPGPIRISHILRRFAPTLEDSAAVRDTAWAIYHEIRGGLDFAEAVKRYSQDPGTAARSGDIGYVEHARLPEDLGAVLYGTPVGDITEPRAFPYGYHLFKVTDQKPVPTFVDLERELRNQYQETRYQTDYQDYLHSLKKKFKLSYDVEAMYHFTHAFDSTKTPSMSGWRDSLHVDLLSRTLFTFADKTFRVDDAVNFMSTSQEFRATTLTSAGVENMVERFTELNIMEEAAKDVPRRYESFAKLMKEYEDGILLFRVEQDEVWNKVTVSDSALRSYYQANSDQFRWPDRVNVQEILVETDSLAKAVYRLVQRGERFDSVAAKYTMRPYPNRQQKGVWGLLPATTNETTKKAWSMAVDSVAEPYKTDEGWSFFKVLQKDPARTKTYDEALPEVTSAYREYASKLREQDWVNELMKKYGVKIQKSVLAEVFRKKTSEMP